MLIKFLLAIVFTGLVILPKISLALDINLNRINIVPTSTPTVSRTRTIIVLTPTPTPTPTLIPTPTFMLQRVNTDDIMKTPSTVQRETTINTQISPSVVQINTRKFIPIATPSISFQKADLPAIATAPASLGIITNSEIATREGKLVEVITAQEKLKLFGLIPITSRVDFEIEQDTNGIRRTYRPWWSFLAIKPDWGTFFQKAGPNLTITNVTWDKKSYHTGDMANISFKIKNTGTKYFLGHYDVVWREGEKLLGDKKDFYSSLAPGESVDFIYFQPWSYECDKTIFLEIDEKNEIKETDKSDNVWQGVTRCAPTTGPDLAVNQLKLNNSFYPYTEKRIGVQNNVKYVIQNIGNEVSVKTRALMKTTSGQYLALIDVPSLAPSLQFSGEVHYTPNDCSPIELNIDTENKNTEPNKDNNYAIESPEIADHCKKGPDMSFGIHHYTLKDGSGFKPRQNGEPLLFQVQLINSATDQTWGCAHNVTLAVYEDDKLFSTFNEGNFGFGDNCPQGGGTVGTYDHPTKTKTQKFWYPAKCGAMLNFVIDPDITFSDIDRSNNTWSQPIECQ